MIMQRYCGHVVFGDLLLQGRNDATGNILLKQETCGKPPDTLLLMTRYVLQTRLDTQPVVVPTHTFVLL